MGHTEGIFYNGGGDILEQVAQRSFGCPVFGSVQGQAGEVFDQIIERCSCQWQGRQTRSSLKDPSNPNHSEIL